MFKSILIVNVILYFSFCILTGTGLMLELRFDESGSTVFGMDSEEWSDIHEMTAYTFLVVVTLHLILHRAWLRGLAMRHFWKTTLGLAGGACMIGASLFVPGNTNSDNTHNQSQEESREKD